MDIEISEVMEQTLAWVKYAGLGLFLSAYFALQFGLVRGTSYVYAGVNVLAAGLILIGLIVEYDVEELAVHSTWIVISLLGILRLQVLSRLTRFSEEEETFLSAKLPDLDRRVARLLLNQGEWRDIPEGEVLIAQGAAAESLFYIAAGSACVAVDGAEVAVADPGAFAGEVTVLEGAPAIATVTAQPGLRCLTIDAAALRALVATTPEIRTSIQESFGRELRAKLAAANAARLASA